MPGLDSERAIIGFYVNGFDPNIMLCIEPRDISLSVWLTGKFAILDGWSGKAIAFDGFLEDIFESILSTHGLEGLPREQFMGFLAMMYEMYAYLDEEMVADILHRSDRFGCGATRFWFTG